MVENSFKKDLTVETHSDDTLEVPQVSQEIAPELKNDPARDGYNAPPSYASNKEWEDDRRTLGKARHDALNGFLEATVIQRSNLLRDLLAVSITILFGALTLYFTSAPEHEEIKTQWLFFFGLLVLVAGTVTNLIARTQIIRHLQQVSHQIERSYLDLFETSRNVMKNPSQVNIDTAYRIENTPIEFAKLKWVGEHGHRVVIWSLVMCVVTVALSFIVSVQF